MYTIAFNIFTLFLSMLKIRVIGSTFYETELCTTSLLRAIIQIIFSICLYLHLRFHVFYTIIIWYSNVVAASDKCLNCECRLGH